MLTSRSDWYVTSDLARAAEVARAVAPRGVSVQLRGADVTEDLARALRGITRDAGVRFLVNRREELARAVGADGLHTDVDAIALVRSRWPSAFLSAPCHSDDDVRRAVAAGADAVLVSPIFATPGKGTPRGVAALAAARDIVAAGGRRVDVIALGGVTLANAAACRANGAAGVAAIRLFEEAPDAGAVAQALAT